MERSPTPSLGSGRARYEAEAGGWATVTLATHSSRTGTVSARHARADPENSASSLFQDERCDLHVYRYWHHCVDHCDHFGAAIALDPGAGPGRDAPAIVLGRVMPRALPGLACRRAPTHLFPCLPGNPAGETRCRLTPLLGDAAVVRPNVGTVDRTRRRVILDGGPARTRGIGRAPRTRDASSPITPRDGSRRSRQRRT